MSIINSQPRIGAAGQSTGFKIERSLRFNSADSAYLNRTPASAGNQKTWTWSAWVKRSKLGSSYFEALFAVSGTPRQYLSFYQDKFYMYGTGSTGDFVELSSNAVYRDTSAWYHLVVAYDTTQATGSNRVKVYINGVEQTLTFTTTPTQNSDGAINRAGDHFLGAETVSANRFNGYLTEVYFIDGQALTPSSFGQTNSATGVWEPIAYTGTYGTNGFYLNFSDNSGTTSTTLGKDSSGNGNNWTPNNFSVTAGAGNDSLVDTPTPYGTDTGAGGEVRGNYCTLNPLATGSFSLANGNLDVTVSAASGSSAGTWGTIGVSSGKWYFEMKINTSDTFYPLFGIINATDLGKVINASGTNSYWLKMDGQKVNGNTTSTYGSDPANGDTVQCALDLDAGSVYFGLNGNWANGTGSFNQTFSNAVAAFSSLSGTFLPVTGGHDGYTATFNFGQRPFAYTAPSGFKALCTQNLPTPTIGATSTTQAGKYFNTVLYTGTGSSLGVTGAGFQPDFVWIKSRSAATEHGLYDAVRGVQKQWKSNSSDAETTETTGLTAFNSNGFTVGALAQLNTSSATYASWNWKANGAGSSNTAGSITSTVSANADAGFSIVAYNSGASGDKTVGHGLGVAPSMIITKSRSSASYNWSIYHASVATTVKKYLTFTTGALDDNGSNIWGSAFPTSSVFGISSGNGVVASTDCIAYCFAPVAGYSAFGSYTGNGSSDGPFVYVGFRPRYILFKNSSAASGWNIFDTARDTYNAADKYLGAQTSAAESSGTAVVDILSNGFKVRNSWTDVNGSGNTIVYAAFAEVPQKFSLAR